MSEGPPYPLTENGCQPASNGYAYEDGNVLGKHAACYVIGGKTSVCEKPPS